MQQSIFDLMYEKYKIKTPIKIIELFGGYGSQFLSLKYIGANVKHHKLVEWASKSIQAYNDLHIDINEFRELYKKREYLKEYLENKFKVEKVDYFENEINFTEYRLKFWFGGLGIQLSNEMIIAYGKDNLCDYCYNLILEQLYKYTEEKYVNDYE